MKQTASHLLMSSAQCTSSQYTTISNCNGFRRRWRALASGILNRLILRSESMHSLDTTCYLYTTISSPFQYIIQCEWSIGSALNWRRLWAPSLTCKTSSPSTHSPNTTYLPSSLGHALKVMKNCDVLEFFPLLAMERIPLLEMGDVC